MMDKALDENRDPNFGNKVYVDSPNPHKHVFNLYWDNDIVQLTKEEAKNLIPLLQDFINQ